MTTDVWGSVQNRLRKDLGSDAYNNWIDPLVYEGLDNQVVRFKAPTGFLGNWVSRNYSDKIQGLFIEHGADVTRVEFATGAAKSKAASSAAEQPQVAHQDAAMTSRATGSAELPGAPLDARFTFEDFVVGKPNELAHAAARRVAEGGPVTFNPLFLYGGVGLGKTHLMHAIAWEARRRDPNARVLYLSAEQFMYRFVQALRFKDTMSFKELFRSVDLLMVDDVQFIAGKDSTQDEFFHTFNALIDQNKQIVISADRAPGEID